MSKNAVVIDDDADVRDHLTSILEGHGWQVRAAADAVEGERLLHESRPDLVLVDLVMPGRSGVQLFARLRGDDRTRDIPIIMVTGIKDQLNIDWKEVVGRLRARVPDGFVEKPVLDPAEFMRLVDDVAGGRATAPAVG